MLQDSSNTENCLRELPTSSRFGMTSRIHSRTVPRSALIDRILKHDWSQRLSSWLPTATCTIYNTYSYSMETNALQLQSKIRYMQMKIGNDFDDDLKQLCKRTIIVEQINSSMKFVCE